MVHHATENIRAVAKVKVEGKRPRGRPKVQEGHWLKEHVS